jgi:2-oxoglutarate ferredoxin oxidoreductase subunit alpha
MERLLKKWDTAKDYVPEPVMYPSTEHTQYGVIFFGTSTASALEAMDYLAEEGVKLDGLRLRAFPFNDTVEHFLKEHEQVFVIEQNRDAQMKMLLVNELGVAPDRLVSILNFDGMPITAKAVQRDIVAHIQASKVSPLESEQMEGQQ